jgi:hypothetical protein
MKVHELFEKVNDKIFFTNFHKEKEVLDGKYKLVATAGYVRMGAPNKYKSHMFKIDVKTAKGSSVGYANFEQHDDHLEAESIKIEPAHREKGLASEVYKFVRELGNDVKPSKLQTGMGKQLWAKIDHSTGQRKE